MIQVNISTDRFGAEVFYKDFEELELARWLKNKEGLFSSFSIFPGPKFKQTPWFLIDYSKNRIEHGDPKYYWLIAYKDGKLLSPENLYGILKPYFEKIKAEYRKVIFNKFDNGRKKRVYGQYRHPKTIQELRNTEERWFEFEDDIFNEFGKISIKFRPRTYLPTAWDDRIYHVQKSWKWQSKRNRQFKEK
jgi:hypothetical protein